MRKTFLKVLDDIYQPIGRYKPLFELVLPNSMSKKEKNEKNLICLEKPTTNEINWKLLLNINHSAIISLMLIKFLK